MVRRVPPARGPLSGDTEEMRGVDLRPSRSSEDGSSSGGSSSGGGGELTCGSEVVVVEEEEEEVVVEPAELTAAQRTFTPDKPEKLYINPKPSQVGADGRILSLPLLCADLNLHLVCLLHKIRIIRLAIKHMLLLRPRNAFIQCSSALI